MPYIEEINNEYEMLYLKCPFEVITISLIFLNIYNIITCYMQHI